VNDSSSTPYHFSVRPVGSMPSRWHTRSDASLPAYTTATTSSSPSDHALASARPLPPRSRSRVPGCRGGGASPPRHRRPPRVAGGAPGPSAGSARAAPSRPRPASRRPRSPRVRSGCRGGLRVPSVRSLPPTRRGTGAVPARCRASARPPSGSTCRSGGRRRPASTASRRAARSGTPRGFRTPGSRAVGSRAAG
jgi:hypothetical protein